jgi:hypothetical protein
MPAAKRNFFIRHGHGLFQTSKELNKHVDNVFGITYSPDDDEGLSSPHATRSCDDIRVEDNQHQANSSSWNTNSTTVASKAEGRDAGHRTLSSKEQAWLQLLHDRPTCNDQTKMAHWAAKIMQMTLPDNNPTMPMKGSYTLPMQDSCMSTFWQEEMNGRRSTTMGAAVTMESASQQQPYQETEFQGFFDGLGNISNFFDD